jgi:general stress protein YciG
MIVIVAGELSFALAEPRARQKPAQAFRYSKEQLQEWARAALSKARTKEHQQRAARKGAAAMHAKYTKEQKQEWGRKGAAISKARRAAALALIGK